MPLSLNVVRFSDEEKTTLQQAAGAAMADRVAREVRTMLRAADDPVKAAVKGVDADLEQLRAANAALQNMQRILATLPSDGAQTKEATRTVDDAMRILNEGIDMLG